MSHSFGELSFSFTVELFRAKCGAESRGDINALASLKNNYPELFSAEFMEFIETLKATATYLEQKYGEDFSSIFVPKTHQIAHILN